MVLLDHFTSENYSSYIIASNISGSLTSDISSKIWVAQEIHLISNSYNSENILLPFEPYEIHFYALASSTFNVTFPLLYGSNDTYVLVELSEFVESGLNSSVLESQSLKPSTDTQSVIFTLELSSFVKIAIANEGASGTFSYSITIKKISLEGAKYVCTVNSTSTCQGMGMYDNNYILSQTTPESASVYPIISVTLVGKEKPGPMKVDVFLIIPAVVLIVVGAICLTCSFILLYCVITHYLR